MKIEGGGISVKLDMSFELYEVWISAAAKLGCTKEELMQKLLVVANEYGEYDEGTLLAVVRGKEVLTTFTGL